MDEHEDTPAEEKPLDPLFQFWGVLAPIERQIVWRNARRRVGFHVLTNSEEVDLIQRVASFPEAERIMREAEIRGAYAVDSVDGKEVNWTGGEIRDPAGILRQDELIARANWVHTWPGPLLDTVLVNYDIAARLPLQELEALVNDPNPGGVRSSNGEPSTVSPTSPEGY